MKLFAQGWSRGKDGPGNRRIYYLKGCNLRCSWCASPESISPEPQLLFYPERHADFAPEPLCPRGAISGSALNREICAGCTDCPCAKVRHPAIEWVGFRRTPEEIAAEVRKLARGWGDFSGVTFGGGEPSLQAEEAAAAMRLLKADGIHTAFESNATAPGFPSLVQTADMTIADLKAGTPETFAAHTGGRLESVIENLTFAAAEAPALLIRIPLITGINDIPDERNAMTEILYRLHQLRRRKQNRNLAVELLKLHHFGAPKYRAMGQTYLLEGRPEPAPGNVDDLEQKLTSLGMEIQKN